MEEEVEQLRRRIEWREKVMKEKRACKEEEEEEKELQEMTCNVQVHVSNYSISVCTQHSYIISFKTRQQFNRHAKFAVQVSLYGHFFFLTTSVFTCVMACALCIGKLNFIFKTIMENYE